MQNNRCIGPIHAMAEWTKRCARHSHGVGSKPIRGIFGNIFIELFFLFYFINKNNQCNVCKYNIISQHTHTWVRLRFIPSINWNFEPWTKIVVGKKNSRPGPELWIWYPIFWDFPVFDTLNAIRALRAWWRKRYPPGGGGGATRLCGCTHARPRKRVKRVLFADNGASRAWRV